MVLALFLAPDWYRSWVQGRFYPLPLYAVVIVLLQPSFVQFGSRAQVELPG